MMRNFVSLFCSLCLVVSCCSTKNIEQPLENEKITALTKNIALTQQSLKEKQDSRKFNLSDKKDNLIVKANHSNIDAMLELAINYNFIDTKEGLFYLKKWYPNIERIIDFNESFSSESLNNITKIVLLYIDNNDRFEMGINKPTNLLNKLSNKGVSEASVEIIKRHLYEETEIDQLQKIKNNISEEALNNLYDYFSIYNVGDDRELSMYEYFPLKIDDLGINYTKKDFKYLSNSKSNTLRIMIALVLKEKGYEQPISQMIMNIPLFLDNKKYISSLVARVIKSNNFNNIFLTAEKISFNKEYKNETIQLYQAAIKISSNIDWVESSVKLLSLYNDDSSLKKMKNDLSKTPEGRLVIALNAKSNSYFYKIINDIENSEVNREVFSMLIKLNRDPKFSKYLLSIFKKHIANENNQVFKDKIIEAIDFVYTHSRTSWEQEEIYNEFLKIIKNSSSLASIENITQLRNISYKYKDYYKENLIHLDDDELNRAIKYKYKYKNLSKYRSNYYYEYDDFSIKTLEKLAVYGDNNSRLILLDIYKYQQYRQESMINRFIDNSIFVIDGAGDVVSSIPDAIWWVVTLPYKLLMSANPGGGR